MTEQKLRSLRQIFEEGQQKEKKTEDLFSSVKTQEQIAHLCIYEDKDVLRFPTSIVPGNDDLESFFADVATYFPEQAPISAYAHILDSSALLSLESDLKARDKRFRDKRSLNAFIGLIFAEVFSTQKGGGTQSSFLGYASSKRTFSFCAARAALLYSNLPISRIATRWVEIREMTGMGSSPEAVAAINWSIELIRGKLPTIEDPLLREFAELIDSYFKKRASREKLTSHFSLLYSGISEIVPLLNATYDNRIEVFSAILKKIRENSKGTVLDAIAAAFFCNLILPGSFSHASVIERLGANLPHCVLWYGLFAGSSDEFSLTSLAGGVGQKLLRDLTLPFDLAQRPACDLSFEEYEVLSRLPLKAEILKPTQAKAILISLIPGVEVYVRSVGDDDESVDKFAISNMLAERNARLSRVRELIRHADQLLEEERYLEQSNRFPGKPSRKYR